MILIKFSLRIRTYNIYTYIYTDNIYTHTLTPHTHAHTRTNAWSPSRINHFYNFLISLYSPIVSIIAHYPIIKSNIYADDIGLITTGLYIAYY